MTKDVHHFDLSLCCGTTSLCLRCDYSSDDGDAGIGLSSRELE